MQETNRRKAFTLIELLVVIAIIAVLIGVLLPALGEARASGRQLKAAANARSVVQAVYSYVSDTRFFPPSYVYAAETTGLQWRLQDQQEQHPRPEFGYIHWSGLLFDGGYASEDSFTAPILPMGGAPASNPNSNLSDAWEVGQTNDVGSGPGSPTVDRQVKRLAFTANSAILARNKLLPTPGRRNNILVTTAALDQSAKGAAGTIMITEFAYKPGWKSLEYDGVGGPTIKSHRSVTPFRSDGGTVYNASNGTTAIPPYFYPRRTDILPLELLPDGAIDEATSATTLNAVGRHYGGKNKSGQGGKNNFAFCDGHVEAKTLLETVEKRQWGDRFFTMSGNNTRVDVTPEP